ncbi:tRNA-(ms[2]io[6]A)-hydroxylase [Aliidiomarina iranensis]|uniref:tRNA-(Ms[2]io[6]A)-hydroxylase n=1 Tax=Aliidiomarina iranensis TaxID=1434071 RepID=A0A432VXJ0_9GAMM|nr:tRNA-(ms[2]io[6]A)-hydroxylase [Aliidiomarina iranensis]
MPVNLLNNYQGLLNPINNFLLCKTPDLWIEQASDPCNLSLLLTDHLHCELKAAQSAGLLLRRYVVDEATAQQILQWLEPYETRVYRGHLLATENETNTQLSGKNKQAPKLELAQSEPWQDELLSKMVLLMKEELHHFDQVFTIMEANNIELQPTTAARYAAGMLRHIRGSEVGGLVDKLIIGGIIEARSCERFAALVPHLPESVARFYVSLLRSEARHFEDYLSLAELVAGEEDIAPRVQMFLGIEQNLIESPDKVLRFHSGPVA